MDIINIEYFKNNKYELPLNIPEKHTHRYLEVINLGYAKYLDIIYNCGNFIMYNQFAQLLGLYEGKNRTEQSNQVITSEITSRLEKLGFISSQYINKNKFLYLRKPSFAIAKENYNNSARLNLNKDLKNDKFKIAIMKIECFIQRGLILDNSYMMEQLKRITKEIMIKIQQTGNKYGYALMCMKEILVLEDFKDINNYLNEHSEFHYKLGVVRELWINLGELYRKLLLQRQTISPKPAYLKIFVKEDGRVVLHYVPNIVIFDVSHDKRYYRDKCVKLFYEFSNIGNNILRDVQKEFIRSKRKSMGHIGDTHIGYKIVLVGENREVLKEKKNVIDENIGTSSNSPLMGYADIVVMDIGKYLYHASRKSNKFSQKHDERIDDIILSKVASLESKEKGKITKKRVADRTGSLQKPRKKLVDLIKD